MLPSRGKGILLRLWADELRSGGVTAAGARKAISTSALRGRKKKDNRVSEVDKAIARRHKASEESTCV